MSGSTQEPSGDPDQFWPRLTLLVQLLMGVGLIVGLLGLVTGSPDPEGEGGLSIFSLSFLCLPGLVLFLLPPALYIGITRAARAAGQPVELPRIMVKLGLLGWVGIAETAILLLVAAPLARMLAQMVGAALAVLLLALMLVDVTRGR
jgi:hypothetical protein